MSEVARWVARLNVEIFRKKLAEETDENRRQTLLCLLGEEKAKLETATGFPDGLLATQNAAQRER